MKTQCRGCGKSFGGITGFEKHRVGQYTSEQPHYGRRCLADDELAEIGFQEVDGVWRDRSSTNPWTKEGRS